MDLETDYGTFETAYKRLSGAFTTKRFKPGEQDERCRTYFRVLEGFPLMAVLTAGRVLLEKSKRMPAAADWVAAVKKNGNVPTVTPPDVRHMSTCEAAEIAQAAAMHYVGQPCLCADCVRANVDHEPLRFVPTLTPDGLREERAFNPTRHVIETCGHWAHGDELARWYAAKTQFASLSDRPTVNGLRMDRLVHLVSKVTEREPGEEG